MLVSVVVPTRNRASLVTEAVASVLVQTRPADEILVVDDGSDDDTAARLAEQFADRLRILRTPPLGVSAARNTGVRHARGDWVAFLDSDDLWSPDKLARQCQFLAEHPEVDICHTEELWVRRGQRVNPCQHHRKPDGDIFLASLARCLVSPSSVIMRRSLFDRVGGFDPSLPACEDYDLWLRLAVDTPFALLDEPLVRRRGGHADQLSRQYWGMDRFRIAALAGLLASDRLDRERARATAQAIVGRCRILANGSQRRGRSEEAIAYHELAAWAEATADREDLAA